MTSHRLLPKPKPPMAPAKPKPEPAPKKPPPGVEVAKSEASRCEYKRSHCPYEAAPGSPFCPLHKE